MDLIIFILESICSQTRVPEKAVNMPASKCFTFRDKSGRLN
jgi:hypothetical protein